MEKPPLKSITRAAFMKAVEGLARKDVLFSGALERFETNLMGDKKRSSVFAQRRKSFTNKLSHVFPKPPSSRMTAAELHGKLRKIPSDYIENTFITKIEHTIPQLRQHVETLKAREEERRKKQRDAEDRRLERERARPASLRDTVAGLQREVAALKTELANRSESELEQLRREKAQREYWESDTRMGGYTPPRPNYGGRD